MPRKYEPIWNKIKEVGKCKIEAHPAFHARIIKAVTKEKLNDITFKVENEDRSFMKLEIERLGKTIIFILKKAPSVEDL